MGFFKFIWDTIKIAFLMFIEPFIRVFWCIFPKPKKSIKGEIILLTGAGQGLGKELAFRLSALGAVMVLWDINQEKVENVASQLKALGRTVYCYRVDVTNEQEVIRAANLVKEEVGDVGMLFNNAGVFSGQPICKLTSQTIRRSFEVNVLAHFWMLQQFLPRMVELNRGHVVAVASMAGHHGVANMTDYCASKHATVGLMESLYMELHAAKKNNIKLTTINPIIITTGLISNVRTRFPCLLPLMPVEKTADTIVKSILREEEMVFIPPRSKYLNDIMGCFFRRRLRFKIIDYTGYGFDPVVENAPTKNGAHIV